MGTETMETTTCSEAKRNPVTCTIETDTTTIEVVATEALIGHDEDDVQGEQVITMATNSTSSSDMAADVKTEYGKGEEDDDEENITTMYATVLDAAAALDAEDLLEARYITASRGATHELKSGKTTSVH